MSYDAECYCAANDGHLCVFCELESDSRLEKLAKNIAIGAALCKSFDLGRDLQHALTVADESAFRRERERQRADAYTEYFHPGCGRPT